jgi:hypothetical protein
LIGGRCQRPHQASRLRERLKTGCGDVDRDAVRYERLVMQAGTASFTLELHPRLTVVAGVGPVERDALVGELIGSLGSSRTGVHAELVTDDGRHLAVFRPAGARQRVVDVDRAEDVTAEFRSDDGRIDVLRPYGLDLAQARRRMRLTRGDLTAGSQGAELIRRLASLDQSGLWAAAEAVRASDDLLQSEAEAVGSAPEDAAVIERIEQRHRVLVSAQRNHERFRKLSIALALVSALGALPLSLRDPSLALTPLVLVFITVLLAAIFKRRTERAAAAEEKALAEAGAQSYLGFHLQRVNGLLANDESRRRLMTVARQYREAGEVWRAIAGDVRVDWALDHREQVVAAARLQRDMSALGAIDRSQDGADEDRTTDLATVLVARLAELRRLGAGGESFPLVLDEPFSGLQHGVKPSLLEMLGHTAGSPQLVLLTDDDDVASWARLEALTGALAIVEPRPEHQPRVSSKR